jgi:hypothetical protein
MLILLLAGFVHSCSGGTQPPAEKSSTAVEGQPAEAAEQDELPSDEETSSASPSSSVAASNAGASASQPAKGGSTEVVEDPTLPEEGVDPNDGATKIQGKFRSLQGVMHPLSCYCFNCGIVTTSAGEEIEVCFDDFETEVDCKSIYVEGDYETKHNSGEEGACAAGKRRILVADYYKCK